jgi:Ring finger domain
MFCEKMLKDCLICLETIGEPTKDILLKCDCCKNYHNSCLQRWIDERNSCPICKLVVNNKNKDQELVVYHYQNEDFEHQRFLSLYNFSLRYIFAVIYFYFITITMCYLLFMFYYHMMLLVYGWSM